MRNGEINLIIGGKLRVCVRAQIGHACRVIRNCFGARLFQQRVDRGQNSETCGDQREWVDLRALYLTCWLSLWSGYAALCPIWRNLITTSQTVLSVRADGRTYWDKVYNHQGTHGSPYRMFRWNWDATRHEAPCHDLLHYSNLSRQ